MAKGCQRAKARGQALRSALGEFGCPASSVVQVLLGPAAKATASMYLKAAVSCSQFCLVVAKAQQAAACPVRSWRRQGHIRQAPLLIKQSLEPGEQPGQTSDNPRQAQTTRRPCPLSAPHKEQPASNQTPKTVLMVLVMSQKVCKQALRGVVQGGVHDPLRATHAAADSQAGALSKSTAHPAMSAVRS